MKNGGSSLAGRRVLLTRSEEDCAAWAAEFERRGARAVLLPCIHTEALDSPELRRSLEEALATADWLAFTSRRGVEAYAGLRAGTTPLVPSRCRVAVVGPGDEDMVLGFDFKQGHDGTPYLGLFATNLNKDFDGSVSRHCAVRAEQRGFGRGARIRGALSARDSSPIVRN